MPLLKWIKNIWKNISELKADNKKSWKSKWANWTLRPMKQILEIALSTAKVKPKEMSKMDKKMDIGKKEMKVEKKEYKNKKK